MSKKRQRDLPVKKKLELTPEEYALGREFYEKRKRTKEVPRFKVVKSASGKSELYPDFKSDDHEYPAVWCGARARATGTIDENLGGLLLQQAITAITEIDPQKEKVINAVCAAVADIEPKDVIEGMLAAQMVAVHNQAMAYIERAAKTRYYHLRELNLKLANKLMRTFILQVEALKKHRSGGQQKVTVEYVNVNQGGQAIVGTVNRGEGERNEK
jgi:hypothetical protein